MNAPWRLLLLLLPLALMASSARAEAPTFDTLLGLKRGDTAADVARLLGPPDAIAYSGDDPIMRYATAPSDPDQPLKPTLDITIDHQTGRVSFLTLGADARDHHAHRSPLFSLLGLTRADVITALGPPAEDANGTPTWRSTTPDLPGESQLTMYFADDRARMLVVGWFTPTLAPPGRPRLAHFARFAGLARGDREDRVIAVLGPATSTRTDGRSNTRTLEYPGLDITVDRSSGLITAISFGTRATDFLATRGIDEPNLWVLGKSPGYLADHLGASLADDDMQRWHWPSAKRPHGSLGMWCSGRVVPICTTAFVDWIVTAPLPPLPKLRVADFDRIGPLEHGDTEVELRQKLGEPTTVHPNSTGKARYLHYGDHALTVSVDASSGRIGTLRVHIGTGPWLADRGEVDPRLALLGRQRSDWVRVLGRPAADSERQEPVWRTPRTTNRGVALFATCHDADRGLCRELFVIWR